MQEVPPLGLSCVLSSQPILWKSLANGEGKANKCLRIKGVSADTELPKLNSGTVCLISPTLSLMTFSYCVLATVGSYKVWCPTFADTASQEQTCLKKHFTDSLASLCRGWAGWYQPTKFQFLPSHYYDISKCPFQLHTFCFIFEFLMRHSNFLQFPELKMKNKIIEGCDDNLYAMAVLNLH